MSLRAIGRAAIAGLAVGSCLLGAAAPSAAATILLPQRFPVPLPADGDVTLMRVTLQLLPAPGHRLPAQAAVHLFIAHGEGLPGSLVLTGASTTRRSGGELDYDGFVALLNRRGGAEGNAPAVFLLGLDGVSRSAVRTPKPALRSYGNVLARRLPSSFCRAIVADTRRPGTLGFVDPSSTDKPLGKSGRLELARATAALCGGAAAAVNRVNGVLAPLGGGLIGKQASPPPAGFTPQTLAGTWTGTWMNQRFGSSGPASIVATAPDPMTLTFTSNFGGNVFGCGQPPPGSGTITYGTGPNHWNAAGFNFTKTSPNFGTVSLSYDFATSTLTGGGTNPSCNPGLSWTIKGTFTGNTFSGTVAITLPDGSTATSLVSLSRS